MQDRRRQKERPQQRKDADRMPLLLPFWARFQQIALPPLCLLAYASLLFLIAPALSERAARTLSLMLFPLFSLAALALPLWRIVTDFGSNLPQKTATGIFPKESACQRYTAAYLLTAALSASAWYAGTLFSLLLFGALPAVFRDIALAARIVTSTVFVFLVFCLLFISTPVLVTLMSFCATLRAKPSRAKAPISPALLAFLPMYGLTLLAVVLVFMATSFMDIGFIAPLAGAEPLIAVTFLWYLLLLSVLNIAFSYFYFRYSVRLIQSRAKTTQTKAKKSGRT